MNIPNNISNKIYCFWTGDNKMSKQRKVCLNQLKDKSQSNVILVTPETLDNYILEDHPLHEAFIYLSETHKADYLRTYFMRFHGGGYSDVKKTTGSWTESFDKLNKSDKWIIGYKEIPGGAVLGRWEVLVGNCAYICKPNTPFVIEWYDEMIKLLNMKLTALKKNPATHPQERPCDGNGYPMEWNQMLGRIFHKINYKYKDKTINTLPISIFHYYR